MPTSMGFFGKLPGYGDFIERNLARSFLDQWDPWLQRGIAGSQQALAEQWLDNYLTAPLCHFALSPGCVDGQAWLGLFLPSVDKVGRYFPLTLAMPLASNVSLCTALYHNADWFKQLDTIALACLNESPTVEAMEEVIEALPQPQLQPWQLQAPESAALGLCVTAAHVSDMELSGGDVSLLQGLTMIEGLMRQQYPSYSLWCSVATEHSPSTMLTAESLPNPQGFTAMLTGQWLQYGWNTLQLE